MKYYSMHNQDDSKDREELSEQDWKQAVEMENPGKSEDLAKSGEDVYMGSAIYWTEEDNA